MNDNKTSSTLDALREYGIDVAPLEAGYKSKDAIIKYGQQLRDMRKEVGKTQTELAEAADMAQADISRLEKGLGKVGPSLDTMSRLADACGYEFSILLEAQSSQSQEEESDVQLFTGSYEGHGIHADNTDVNIDSEHNHVNLSQRETLCLRLVLNGKTRFEISKVLSISENTVAYHLRNAHKKIKAANRDHAVGNATASSKITLS